MAAVGRRSVRMGELPAGTILQSADAERERALCQLEEFDIEVESRLEEMKAEVKKLTAKLEREFRLELFKVPKAVRAMKMQQFQREFGGVFAAVQKQAMDKKLLDVMMMPPPPPSTARRAKRDKTATEPATEGGTAKRSRTTSKRGASMMPETEGASAEPMTSRRSSRRTTAVPAGEPEMFVSAPTSTRRSTRSSMMPQPGAAGEKRVTLAEVNRGNDFKTPAPATKSRGKAPAQTPAFDPRLPTTPFVRPARQGESFISMNGSPVAADTRTASMVSHERTSIITVPLKDGKCIQLDPSEATIKNVKAALSTKNKKEAVDKLQQLMDQLRGVMTALQ